MDTDYPACWKRAINGAFSNAAQLWQHTAAAVFLAECEEPVLIGIGMQPSRGAGVLQHDNPVLLDGASPGDLNRPYAMVTQYWQNVFLHQGISC